MNWYKLASPQMSVPEALKEFEISSIPPDISSLKTTRNNLAKKFHPDKGGSTEKMQRINNAFDVLKKNVGSSQRTNDPYDDSPQSWADAYQRAQERWRRQNPEPEPEGNSNIPPWETDPRSTYHAVGENWGNLNKCKKDIYEESLKSGPVSPIKFGPLMVTFLEVYLRQKQI